MSLPLSAAGADIGVGTIDQALFGVLPTRFNGLRPRALSQKVLIVDEAHSYDPYMRAQLERLLRMHARLGGSAIVMTATLLQPKKRAFVAAFEHGLRSPRPRRGKSKAPPAHHGLGARPFTPALSAIFPMRLTECELAARCEANITAP